MKIDARVMLVLACATLNGCGLFNIFNRDPLPPRELYRLHLADSGVPLQPLNGGAQLLAGSVAITPYQTPGLYGEHGIVFRQGTSSYSAYPSKEWAVPLGEMLGALTESVFERAPISQEQAVYDPPSRNSHSYLWRATVREFEEVNVGQSVSIAVRIDARLVRTVDDSLIWTGSAQLEKPIPNPTMENIVKGLSDAAIEVINKLGVQAVTELRGSASSAAAAKPAP